MRVYFEQPFRKEYYDRLDNVFDSGYLSEGKQVREFEERFGEFVGTSARAVCNAGAGLLSVYDYLGVSGKDVIVPANTFWATAVAAKKAGANVIYADCNRYDLCISVDDLRKKITPGTKAVTVVHIGGHVAFDIERIVDFCAERKIHLVEDCSHAHGALFRGKAAGNWGIAGVYSFFATKTMPLGEGGMVVSRDSDFLDWLSCYRNYGKKVVDGRVTYNLDNGFNFRMSEVVAALGNVQLGRLDEVLEWKRDLARKFDSLFERRVVLPAEMHSGYYKYIVFDYALKQKTGQVFGRSDLGYNIDRRSEVGGLENTEWIVDHHSCVPIWYGWPENSRDLERLHEVLL